MAANPLHFVILITSLFLAPLSSPLRILWMKKSCKSRPWTSWWTLHTGCRWMAWCLTCQNSHQVSPVVDLVFCEKWKVLKPNTQVHHYLKLLWQWHLAQVQVSARLHQPVQLRFCQFNLMLVCWHLPLLKYPLWGFSSMHPQRTTWSSSRSNGGGWPVLLTRWRSFFIAPNKKALKLRLGRPLLKMYLIGNSYIFSSIICFYGFAFCVGFKFLDLCI